jgi:molybdopterin-guanine dinucleotide biosynthesis protein A
VLVLAADLPFVSVALLSFLADHGAPGSVLPLYDGWPQPLCARYSRPDLETAAEIVKDGRRAMMDLVKLIDPVIVAVEEWSGVTGDPDALLDIDTPADLERARNRLAAQAAPPGSDQA